MKKTILPLIACFLVSFALLPVLKAGSNTGAAVNAPAFNDSAASIDNTASSNSAEAVANSLYTTLNLKSIGLSFDALKYALKGYRQLVDNGTLSNDEVLTVIDFSQPSSKKRMYILDVKNNKVLLNTYVAHGKNTGLQYAEHFSNRPESLQSSLGFYVTKSTYSGKHGTSLRLEGLEKGWNDRAEERAVVVHGAEYIGSSRADAAYMGRSWGCPAVPQSQVGTVINLIKGGTCLFIYHPSADYLQESQLLNS
ncbi:MAG: murein L,D-transpeptidase catalytic domain family protein [Flaviaesturariibacter sp.]|nr:murein L,D-transpeptidase catalytic domain family protein [Flaviaesturariibacter sp.]